jgi:hypothetical protein
LASRGRAFLEQARSDLKAFDRSGSGFDVADHHRLLFLQMALEKLCKSFLYAGLPDGQFSHNVVGTAVRVMRQQDVARAMGIDTKTLSRRLMAAQPVWMRVAAASPSIASDGRTLDRRQSERSQNVEYPWHADPDDPLSWTAPASQRFDLVRELRFERSAVAAIVLMERLADAADKVLPR